MRQPLFFVFVIFNYYYFVRKCGPAWMAQRPAFELRSLMLAYNALQVAFNLGLLLLTLQTIAAQDKSVVQCIESDSNTRRNLLLYVANKYVDLVDTVIFVLRKKQNQVTFLHVHHHCAVVMWTTWTMSYPGRTDGGGSIAILLNTGVHVLMYAYYFVSIWRPEWRHRLASVKKHLTQVQLVQFVLMIAHFSRDVFGYCDEMVWGLSLGGLVQNIFFFYLFGVMYARAYWRREAAGPKVE